MKLMLDTHVLLWAASAPAQLSTKAQAVIADPENQLYYSAASLWEIAIKNKLGRADFKVDLPVFRRNLLDNGYQEIAINGTHTLAVDALPLIHKDPFDRIIIAQANVEGITLMTADSVVTEYQVAVVKV